MLDSIKRSLDFQLQEEEAEVFRYVPFLFLLFLNRRKVLVLDSVCILYNKPFQIADCLTILPMCSLNELAQVLAKDIGKAADADNRDSVYEDHLMCMQVRAYISTYLFLDETEKG